MFPGVYMPFKTPHMSLFTENKAKSALEPQKEHQFLEGICHHIQAHITFPEHKRVKTEDIIRATIAIGFEQKSISGFCKQNNGLPSYTTCLEALHSLDMNEMLQQSSNMLRDAGKGVITPGQKYTFAIDKTEDPYYGKRDEKPDSDVVGSKRKASTNYFHTYLTLSIIDNDRHLTLCVIPWQKGMKNLTAICQCIELIKELNLKIRCLCLDREFYAAEIFSYLQQAGIPHIIPVKKSGAELKKKLTGKRSNTFQYTLNQGSSAPVTVTMTDCLVYLKGNKGKHGTRHHAFVVYGISSSPRTIRGIYKHRFAIESTYRLRNTTKPKTSTRDPVIRYYYTLMAFVIQNWWIALKWRYFAKTQTGPKVIEGNRFPLAHFARLVMEEIMMKYKAQKILDIAISG